MSLTQKFYPKEEIFSNFDYETQKRISNLIVGDLICFISFALFSVVLFVFGFHLVGICMTMVTLAFLASLITIKCGRVFVGSYLVTIGLLAACAVIGFFSSRSTELVHYRTACFCSVMATLNAMVVLKKPQLVIFLAGSIAILITSAFTVFLPTFLENKFPTLGAIFINTLAIAASNSILIASSNLNTSLLKHASKQSIQVQKNLQTITGAISKAKDSMNIGQELNNAANSASKSVSEINSLYEELLTDTDDLREQTKNIKAASEIVNSEAGKMMDTVKDQNNYILKTSKEMEQISTNVSNINLIAQKRQEGLAEVVEILKNQNVLVENLVKEVSQVQESSNEISKFVKTIDDIADQTSLLAMNASIEASHAGVLGKGFSVISQQIRKLSEESSANAAKIAETLKINSQIIHKTAGSVTEFAETTENSTHEITSTVLTIEEIIHGIEEVTNAAKTISGELQLVVEKSEQSNDSINNVVNKVEDQSLSLTAISSSTDRLQESVNNIKNKLEVINQAIDTISTEAKTNEEVTSRLAMFLH